MKIKTSVEFLGAKGKTGTPVQPYRHAMGDGNGRKKKRTFQARLPEESKKEQKLKCVGGRNVGHIFYGLIGGTEQAFLKYLQQRLQLGFVKVASKIGIACFWRRLPVT
ncbi:hypothetical protein TNIN_251481 [Trichonephila inaurata madagascariensis]|uniref:Uncharacterized protein n=1 Tax=Trichonephila inaurata madagascariensis TaxID=2747483 RepID=A0A8X7CBX3_9ARAC|nr:hypothetical protein TNIN_251481 [Trichonephila inaurata madagascariensis]